MGSADLMPVVVSSPALHLWRGHRTGRSNGHTARMDPFHFFAGERLSLAELSAACLDGHLQGLGEGYMPADAVETTWMRARSLTPVLGSSLVATHATAAWIHGALSELPGRLDVQRRTTRRLHYVPQRRLVYRDLQIDPADTVILGGVAVSTIVRTAADLARAGDDYAAALAALLAWSPGARQEARDWLTSHPRLPGTRQARTALA